MPISPISNGEVGLSVREKLNAAIDGINELVESGAGSVEVTAPTVEFTGQWTVPSSLVSVPPAKITLLPGNVAFGSPGPWVNGLDFSEDEGVLTLSLPDLVGVYNDFSLYDMDGLVSMACAELEVVGDDFYINYNDGLEAISFPKLKATGYFELYNNPLAVSISFPELEYVNDWFYVDYQYALVDPPDFAALKQIAGGMSHYGNPNLTGWSFPSLEYVQWDINIYDHENLVSIELPAIVDIYSFRVDWNVPSLTTVVFGETLKRVRDYISITSGQLSQESVDDILVRLAALDGTNDTTVFENQYVEITGGASIPGAAGIAAIAILQDRGNTVIVNQPEFNSFTLTAGAHNNEYGYRADLGENNFGSISNEPVSGFTLEGFYHDSQWGYFRLAGNVLPYVQNMVVYVNGSPMTENAGTWGFVAGATRIEFGPGVPFNFGEGDFTVELVPQ